MRKKGGRTSDTEKYIEERKKVNEGTRKIVRENLWQGRKRTWRNVRKLCNGKEKA